MTAAAAAAAATVRDSAWKAARPVVKPINTALNRDASQPRSLPFGQDVNPGGQSPVSSNTSFETDTDHTDHTDQEDGYHHVDLNPGRRHFLSVPSQQALPPGANRSTPPMSSLRPVPPQTTHHSAPPPPSPPPPSGKKSPHTSSDMPRVLNEELRRIVRQEMATLHPQTHEQGSLPDGVSRITPSTFMDTMFPGAYPSPPPSVTAAATSSRLTSPQGTSPRAANASPATAGLSLSPPTAGPPQRPTVRFRDRGSPIIHSHAKAEAGPPSPARPTGIPDTAGTESAWGVLFDADGYSTRRLGHILRSLASQVVSDSGRFLSSCIPGACSSSHSVFHCTDCRNGHAWRHHRHARQDEHSVHQVEVKNDERFIKDVFKPLKNNTFSHIEFLYRDLDCPYHLVQASPKSRPSVPGLTPAGFIKWFTASILAHPDREARRLNKLLADFGPLVIVGSDEREERLPKIFPRHVFPASHDKKTRRILNEALMNCLDDHNRDYAVSSQQPRSPLTSSSRPLTTPMPSEGPSGTRRMSDPVRRPSGPLDRPDRSTRPDASSDRDVPVGRNPRTQSDNATGPLSSRPPVGRHRRNDSPSSSDRYSASVSGLSGISSLTRWPRGGAGDEAESVRSWASRDRGNERDRERRRREKSPRRRSLVVGGPTWSDFYRNVPRTRGGGSSAERTPRDSHGSR